MIDRVVFRRPEWATLLGSALVLTGLALFMIVFVTLFPILRDPVGAYERWFPSDEPAPVVVTGEGDRTGPIARFAWEAVVVESSNPPVYRARFRSNAAPGAEPITTWTWDLGDGTTADGQSVVHDYATYGAYVVTLRVEDASGASSTTGGQVIVPGVEATSGAIGVIDEFLDLDIEASLEDAVGSVGQEINATIDSAFGSIGTTVRGAVVVFLFALAALAATVVAWRVARVGVMVLTRQPTTGRWGGQPPPPADEFHGERQLELV